MASNYSVAGQGAKGAVKGTILGALGGLFAGAVGGAAAFLLNPLGMLSAAVGIGLGVLFSSGAPVAIGVGIPAAFGALVGASTGVAIGGGAGLGLGLFGGVSKGIEKTKDRSMVREQEIQAAIGQARAEAAAYYTKAGYQQGAGEMKAFIGNQLMAAQEQMQQQMLHEKQAAMLAAQEPEKKFTDTCCAKKKHASHAEAVMESKALAQGIPGVTH